jgi:hypothetical protein
VNQLENKDEDPGPSPGPQPCAFRMLWAMGEGNTEYRFVERKQQMARQKIEWNTISFPFFKVSNWVCI